MSQEACIGETVIRESAAAISAEIQHMEAAIEMRHMVEAASKCIYCGDPALRNDCLCGECLRIRRKWALAFNERHAEMRMP